MVSGVRNEGIASGLTRKKGSCSARDRSAKNRILARFQAHHLRVPNESFAAAEGMPRESDREAICDDFSGLHSAPKTYIRADRKFSMAYMVAYKATFAKSA